ncbi:MAG: hypothetical protein PHC43_00260 [Candidatus Marinimicrobia bacterium]|nr:hypothetical protein [Candidatus Neomarinimicrobiota bacterium]
MKSKFKYSYAFTLLGLTFLWAGFCVWMTCQAIAMKSEIAILGAAGVDTLLGALISWNALIIQHYFRKAIPEEESTGGK